MRYKVRVVKGSDRGDLYELEQITYFQIVDLISNKIIITFEEKMEATISRDSGLWEDYQYSGVYEVTISPDEKTALVKYHDGKQEYIALPESSDPPNPSRRRQKGEQDTYQEPQPTSEDIQELVSFLPLIYREGFKPVKEWKSVRQKDDSISFPYPDYQPEVITFYEKAMQDIWMDHNYKPDEAWEMLLDHQFVANASLTQIKTMLTFCVRGERFVDGHWAQMIEQGHIQRLLERLVIL